MLLICRLYRMIFATMASGWSPDSAHCRLRPIRCWATHPSTGRDYYVRQMKNLKASIPVEFLTGASFNFYAWACGAILARAHARTGDPARIAGYCGNSTALDEAMAEWAESYGDQTEEDHATLLAAIKRGDIKAVQEGNEE